MIFELPTRRRRTLRAELGLHGYRRRAIMAAVVAALPAMFSSGKAMAQSRAANRLGSIAFADFTPESVGLFVGVKRLGDLNAALDRAHAWQLLMILSGASTEQARALNLPKALSGLLGFRGTAVAATLADSEVGLAMPPSMKLKSAVWFIRLSDRSLVGRWFPPDARIDSGATGFVRYFRLRNRWTVAVTGSVLALSRESGPGSLFQKTIHVMAGREESLARSKEFRDAAAYLPENYLAVSHLVGAPKGDGSIATPLSWWPAASHAMIALFERDGRIDVAVRASLVGQDAKAKLARSVIDRLQRLPSTTLAAAAISMDIAPPRRTRNDPTPPGLLARYLAFLSGLTDPLAPAGAQPQLGPHILFAWGQDLSEGGSTPQVALMVECADGIGVRQRARRMVEGLLRFLALMDPDLADAAPTIVRTRHLGATVFSVPFADYAAKSAIPFMQVVRDVSPAWTVWNGWLILAVSRDHLERILDAQYGLIPGLAAVEDVRGMRLTSADRAAVSIVQPDLATKVLEGWLAVRKAGTASVLDPAWWGGVDPADTVEELASVGRSLEFGSYAVDVSDPGYLSARVSLRFRSGQVSKKASP